MLDYPRLSRDEDTGLCHRNLGRSQHPALQHWEITSFPDKKVNANGKDPQRGKCRATKSKRNIKVSTKVSTLKPRSGSQSSLPPGAMDTNGHPTFQLPGPPLLAALPSHSASKLGVPPGLQLDLCSRWTHSFTASCQFHLLPHSRWKHPSTGTFHREDPQAPWTTHPGQSLSRVSTSAPLYPGTPASHSGLSPTPQQLAVTSPAAPTAAGSLSSGFSPAPLPPQPNWSKGILLPWALISVTPFLHTSSLGQGLALGRCSTVTSNITTHFHEWSTMF